MLNVPIRLMPITRANVSSLCGPSLPTVFSPAAIPAQLIRPRNVPRPRAAATTALPSLSLAHELGNNARFVRQRFALVRLQVGNDDPPARACEQSRGRAAKAGCTAGDDEGVAAYFHGPLPCKEASIVRSPPPRAPTLGACGATVRTST